MSKVTSAFVRLWVDASIRSTYVNDDKGKLAQNRFVITGYADTKPIADNTPPDGRAANRRVEIIIVQGEQPVSEVVGIK